MINKGIHKISEFFSKYIVCIMPAVMLLQAFLLVTAVESITFYDSNIFYDWMDISNLFNIFYNVFIYVVFLLLLYAITNRLFISYTLVWILTMVVSVINHLKWNSLQDCVSVSDLKKISEAMQVAGDSQFIGTYKLIVWGIIFVVTSVFCFLLDRIVKSKEKKHTRIKYLIAAIVLIFIFAISLLLGQKQIQVAKLTEARNAKQIGPIAYFLESMLTESMNVSYTKKEALASYNKYVEKGRADSSVLSNSSQEMPNVIVIMSESFYDVNQLQGDIISYSEDPMKDFYDIQKESISGNTYTNIYGGSTHYSEFEFLTGWNTKGMDINDCPYKDYFKNPQPSIARYFKGAGYNTMAIHPYDGRFWNRYVAYGKMGFDKFVDRGQMKYTDMCGYISDEALTNEIIYQYEDKKDTQKPFFCFAVSIANHIATINGEQKENMSEAIDVNYSGSIAGYDQNKKRRFKQYVSGIAKSAEALKELTNYYKTVDEPTVIVFFGDHAPSYALDLLNAQEKEETLAYSTPFIMWSNYDMENAAFEEMTNNLSGDKASRGLNVSYLSTYMLCAMNLPLPSQGYYELGLLKDYPIETRYQIINQAGESSTTYDKIGKEAYLNRALDLKRQINGLLENPAEIEHIWDYPK